MLLVKITPMQSIIIILILSYIYLLLKVNLSLQVAIIFHLEHLNPIHYNKFYEICPFSWQCISLLSISNFPCRLYVRLMTCPDLYHIVIVVNIFKWSKSSPVKHKLEELALTTIAPVPCSVMTIQISSLLLLFRSWSVFSVLIMQIFHYAYT